MGNGLTGLMPIFIFLGLLIAVLWIILPFAVFGIKDLLKELIEVNRIQNDKLNSIANLLANKKDNDQELRSLIQKLKQ